MAEPTQATESVWTVLDGKVWRVARAEDTDYWRDGTGEALPWPAVVWRYAPVFRTAQAAEDAAATGDPVVWAEQHPSAVWAHAPLSGPESDEQADPQGFGYVPVPASFLTLLAEAVKPYDDQGRARPRSRYGARPHRRRHARARSVALAEFGR